MLKTNKEHHMTIDTSDVFHPSETAIAMPEAMKRINIAIDKLFPRKANEAISIDDDEFDMEELLASMVEHGVRIPLIVEINPEARGAIEPSTYTVIAGHRRLSAAKTAKMETLPCIVYPQLSEEQREELDRLSNISRTLTQWQAALRWYRLKKSYFSRRKGTEDAKAEIAAKIPKLQQMAKISGAEETIRKTITVIRTIEKLFQEDKEKAVELKDMATSRGWMAAYKATRPTEASEHATKTSRHGNCTGESIVTPVTVDSPAETDAKADGIDITHEPETACGEYCQQSLLPQNVDTKEASLASPEEFKKIPKIVPMNTEKASAAAKALSRAISDFEKEAGAAPQTVLASIKCLHAYASGEKLPLSSNANEEQIERLNKEIARLQKDLETERLVANDNGHSMNAIVDVVNSLFRKAVAAFIKDRPRDGILSINARHLHAELTAINFQGLISLDPETLQARQDEATIQDA